MSAPRHSKKLVDDDDSLLSIAVNGNQCAVCSEKGRVLLVNINPQLELIENATIQGGLDQEVTSVCFAKKTPHNLFCSAGQFIHLIDTRNLSQTVEKFHFNSDDINTICLSSCEKYLLSADDTGVIQVINLETNSLYTTLKRHRNVCFSITPRPNRSSEVLTGGYDCNVIRWDFMNRRYLQQFDVQLSLTTGGANNPMGLPFINPPYILCLAFNKTGTMLAAGSQDGSVNFWDARKSKIKPLEPLFEAHSSLGVTAVEFLDSIEVKMVTAGNDGIINIWDAAVVPVEKPPCSVLEHGSKINGLCVANNSRLLVCDTTSCLSLYEL